MRNALNAEEVKLKPITYCHSITITYRPIALERCSLRTCNDLVSEVKAAYHLLIPIVQCYKRKHVWPCLPSHWRSIPNCEAEALNIGRHYKHRKMRNPYRRMEITSSLAGFIAVLMASAIVVLKHETSTHRLRHSFISIDFKFGVGDYKAIAITRPFT